MRTCFTPIQQESVPETLSETPLFRRYPATNIIHSSMVLVLWFWFYGSGSMVLVLWFWFYDSGSIVLVLIFYLHILWDNLEFHGFCAAIHRAGSAECDGGGSFPDIVLIGNDGEIPAVFQCLYSVSG